MTPLNVLVAQFGDLSNAQTILDSLQNKNIKSIIYSGPQSIAAVEAAYGDVFTITLIETMNAVIAGLRQANQGPQADYLQIYFDRLTKGIGLDFSSDLVRSKLDELVPMFGPTGQDSVDKLKNLGYYYISELDRTGWTDIPSLDDVQSAINTVLEKRDLDRWYALAVDILKTQYDENKTIDEIKSAIQGIN